jgi:hypothetical protein
MRSARKAAKRDKGPAAPEDQQLVELDRAHLRLVLGCMLR